MNQKRVILWDNLKFFLILTVVLGHFVEPYIKQSHFFKFLFLFIYSFHMPLFIFISGVFFNDKHIKESVLGYLAVFFTYKVANLLVNIALKNDYSFSLFTESGIPWFLLALVFYYGVAHCLQGVNKTFLFFFALGIGCFSGYDKDIGDFLALSRIIVYFPWFLLGTMVSREKLELAAQKRSVKIVSILLLCIIACAFYFNLERLYKLRPFFTGRNAFPKDYLEIGTLVRIQCYLISGVIGLAAILATPCKKIPLVTSAGRKTLQIYFWHIFGRKILALLGVDVFLLSYGAAGKLAWLACAVTITFLCACYLFSFPTAQLIRAPYVIIKNRNSEERE